MNHPDDHDATAAGYLKEVRDHYEEYPYPERDPENEKKQLKGPVADGLDHINYHCFQGSRIFTKDFRVLVAGGGTGDATIFLAEQLRDTGAQITYLDISQASMKVAQERARVRQLENITWIHGSLLDLPDYGLGKFDYINCSGVLHHLDDPSLGQSALDSVLDEDGAMMIMVYAKYGRTAVYQVQELMRHINRDETGMQGRVDNCKSILGDLPEQHWFGLSAILMPDFKTSRDIEIYDLFLHSNDRAYSIPELYEYFDGEGLKILHLVGHGWPQGNTVYEPETYIRDKSILKNLAGCDTRERQTIAELMNGRILMHVCHVAKKSTVLPDPGDLDNIPGLSVTYDKSAYEQLYNIICNSTDEVSLTTRSGTPVIFGKTPHTEEFFRYLDGDRSLQDIFEKIIASSAHEGETPTDQSLLQEFREIFPKFNCHNMMFLRGKSVEHPKTIPEMQARVSTIYSQ